MSSVVYKMEQGVAYITLNRPDAFNAMTHQLMTELKAAFETVEADDQVRVVVLTGAGRGFCSGADLSDRTEKQEAPDTPDEDAPPQANAFGEAMQAIHDCSVPTVARINGAAAGGGMGLALSCDITVAARKAFFVATFSPNLGIAPDLGVTWALPRLTSRARALGVALLGDRISADQALEWGLIWSVVDEDQLDTEIEAITATLKRSSPDAIVRTRKSIDAAFTNSYAEQLTLEFAHQAELIPRNMAEGAKAFFEKRTPVFDGTRYRHEEND
jgi:2-(1,2-epoxy-1,2-dihydrophenyl)acetyl-CoA isomerase